MKESRREKQPDIWSAEGRRRRAAVFDTIVDDYERHRPGYPLEMFQTLQALVAPAARVLEIGAGTGKATTGLAACGFRLVCLEPGANLAAALRRNTAGFGNVEVLNVSFEAWPAEPGGFDAVTAAQSFHWTDPATRLQRAALALKPGGVLAPFWNSPANDPSPLEDEIQQVYRRVTPELAARFERRPVVSEHERWQSEFNATGLFESVEVRGFPWSKTFATEEYLALIGTYSENATLPQSTRRELFDGLRSVIDAAGGKITRDYVCRLHIGRIARSRSADR
ncbi:MAG: methyltransferase domain-containing protein [Armatimonadetes bacterium]|nr:methyltransferase domain-containing protein [Armatimonadota bacterium]